MPLSYAEKGFVYVSEKNRGDSSVKGSVRAKMALGGTNPPPS